MTRNFFLILITAIFWGCTPEQEPRMQTTITLNDTVLTMKPERTYTLKAIVTPPSDSVVVWTSSDESVATVFMGIVTSKKEGVTIITASVDGISVVCKVTVRIPQYQLIWEDNFDGNVLSTEYWTNEKGGGGGNGEQQYYTDGTNISLEDGQLILKAKKEDYTSSITGIIYNYTSARINTKNKIKFTYGKIEARISLPSGNGTWPAFWLMPNDDVYGGWPRSGEIDIMEHVGSDPKMISHAYHTKNNNTNTGTNWSMRTSKDGVEGNFHTYTLEWENDYLNGRDAFVFYVDSVQTGFKVEPENATWEDWPFDKNFYIILNLALGGSWGGTIDDDIFDDSVEMRIDWIKFYQRE
ncbi:MAG: family 16 glycosylhydrolase [Paludibacter sp.]|nr:family 16 glycosylhydrolase [Paludibacter sp.]